MPSTGLERAVLRENLLCSTLLTLWTHHVTGENRIVNVNPGLTLDNLYFKKAMYPTKTVCHTVRCQLIHNYVASQALHYKKYSTASDVWGFGCLMYEIWSLGHKPFEKYTNSDVCLLSLWMCSFFKIFFVVLFRPLSWWKMVSAFLRLQAAPRKYTASW